MRGTIGINIFVTKEYSEVIWDRGGLAAREIWKGEDQNYTLGKRYKIVILSS